jgi:hypothetical protein
LASRRALILTLFGFALACGGGAPAPRPPPPPPIPPLPAPTGLSAVRFHVGVVLSWNPVAGASSYSVRATYFDIPRGILVTQYADGLDATTVASGTGVPANGNTSYAVAAVNAASTGIWSDEIEVPDAPGVIALPGIRRVHLEWNGGIELGTHVVVGRGRAADKIAVLAEPPAGTVAWDDTDVEPASTWYYEIKYVLPAVVAFSGATSVTLPPRAAVVTAAPNGTSGVSVAWDEVPGARSYIVEIAYQTGGPYTSLYSYTSGTSAQSFCNHDTVCFFRVTAVGDGGKGETSAEAFAEPQPEAPFVAASSRIGAVAVQWSHYDGDVFVLERSVDGGPFVEIARQSATEYLDAAVRSWTRTSYRVRAVRAWDGAVSELSNVASGFATQPADQLNLAPPAAWFAVDRVPGQTFTVANGGQLMGIEVPGTAGAVWLSLWSGPLALARSVPATNVEGIDLNATALVTDAIHGRYFDLSALALEVSEGETLRFQLSSSPGALGAGGLWASADVYGAGTASSGGVGAPAYDLQFKSFVRTERATIRPPAVSQTAAGDRSIAIAWQASAGADRYEVLAGASPDALALLGTTTDTSWVQDGLEPGGSYWFAVRAVSPSATATGDTVQVSAASTIVADAVLAHEGEWSSVQIGQALFATTATLGQSMLPAEEGRLAAVVLATAAHSTTRATLRLFDGATQIAQSATTIDPPAECCAPPALDLRFENGTVFDFSPSGVLVAAGHPLRFELTVESASVDVRDVAAGAAGESANGIAVPGRALSYKLVVTPP